MIQKSVLCLLQQPPYLSSRVFETFDALLVAAAFEQKVSLLFRGAGVTGLLKNQKPSQQRSMSKILQSLEAYEISAVYVDQASLQHYNMTVADCTIKTIAQTQQQIAALINQHDVVLSD